MKRLIGGSCLILIAVSPGVLLADNTKGALSLSLENDMFGSGTDQHYTHGTEMSYISDTYMPDWFKTVASYIPINELNDDTRFSWSLGQKIYTPDDIEEPSLIEDDRPYAGWTYLSLGLVTEATQEKYRHVDSLEFILGIVGPKSGAEDAQTAVHDFIGVAEPQGWKHQLDNEYTLDLRYARSWRIPVVDDYMDVLPTMGFTLGSSRRMVKGGLTVRLGSGLNTDFGPPLIRPSSAGSYYFEPHQSFYWYFFAGVHGRYVDYNVFLDGNRDGDSHSVERREWVGDIQAGLVMGYGNWRATLTNIYRTEEFVEQSEPDEFGSLSIAYRF